MAFKLSKVSCDLGTTAPGAQGSADVKVSMKNLHALIGMVGSLSIYLHELTMHFVVRVLGNA